MREEYAQSTAIRRNVSARLHPANLSPNGRYASVSGLTLDVIRPAAIDPDVKLPVAVVSTLGPRSFLLIS